MEEITSNVNQFGSLEDLQKGTVLLINKDVNWTSFSVVNKLRWLIKTHLKIKKIKVGHAGTLDPLATGLLVICTGKMTKQIQYLIDENKSYTGTIGLGQTTDSFDLETELSEKQPTEHITAEQINEVALSFIGEQEQRPPLFSAKKINGVRAYELARKGSDVQLKLSKIRIDKFEITGFDNPNLDFFIKSTKGTYIRSIANDFGKKIGSGGYLKSLHRVQSGKFHIDQSITIQEFEDMLKAISNT